MQWISKNCILPVLVVFALLISCSACLFVSAYAADTSTVLQAGQWECNTYVMTGEYSELTDWPSGLGTVSLEFTSSGVAYTEISQDYDLQTSKGDCLYYGDTLVYCFGTSTTDPGWIQDAYALIYLATDQEVSQDFYDWFTANFTYQGSAEVVPEYTTTVNIYNFAGTDLLASYTVSGELVAPSITGTVLDNGLQIQDVDGQSWSWTGAGDPFYGFALKPQVTLVTYDPGEAIVGGGAAADFTLDLYEVNTEQTNTEYQNGVLGWLESLFDRIGGVLDDILEALSPSEGQKLLGIINFDAIGDFFKDAYKAVTSVFGLQDLVDAEDSPFAWLKE